MDLRDTGLVREAQDDIESSLRERTDELLRANERLKEEIAERVRTEGSLRFEEARLDALLRLAEMQDPTAAEVCSFILEQAIALTRSRIGLVGFLSEDELAFTLHAVSKDVVRECRIPSDPPHWPIGSAGIWADAIRGRRTLFVNDYSRPDPRKRGLPPGHLPLERFMVVPVFEGKRIDIGLPGMDGYELARAVRADGSCGTPLLVALTGYALPEDIQLARDAGFDHHMAKPPSVEKIQELLGRPEPPEALHSATPLRAP